MAELRRDNMKFLCLAYGSADDWNAMTKQEQAEVLEQDERIRNRGDFMAAVQTAVTTITNWNGNLITKNESYSKLTLPLAGFSIIESKDIDDVIQLVANTPCARAKGAIEIRPFWDFNEKPAK
jgi:hypothetical protein